MKAIKPVSGYLAKRGGYYHTVICAYVDGKRKPISRTTGLPIKNNERRARKILEERKREYDEQGLSGMLTLESRQLGNTMLLSEYMEKELNRKKGNLAPTTFDGYMSQIRGRIRRYFDPREVTLGTLTPQLIEDFLDTIRADGCGSSTQISYYQRMNSCLKHAVQKDQILRNPMEKVDRPKLQRHPATYFTRDELFTILESVKKTPYYIPILIGAFYGFRRCEIIALQWSSIDFEHNTISVNYKAYKSRENGESRTVITDRLKTTATRRTLPLIPCVRDALLEHQAKQKEYAKSFRSAYNRDWSNFVCVTPTGDLIKPDTLTQQFGKLLKKIHLEKGHLHSVRHSNASLLVSSGMSMKHTQLWLGHANYSTTADIYAHLSTADMDEPASCISGLLTPLLSTVPKGESA
ncbi:MAG: site-specific integrase [Oscillibacter sp.]|nr:site-specific integrase [Oscillibacter sp.]